MDDEDALDEEMYAVDAAEADDVGGTCLLSWT